MKKTLPIFLLLAILYNMLSLSFLGCGTTVPPSIDGISRETALTMFGVTPTTLDPAVASELSSYRYIAQIFSGLVAVEQKVEVVPDIAGRWKVSNHGRTYTFYLRSGVKFHDGKEVKADDFKYSMERALNPETKSQTALTYLGDIVGAKEMLAGEATEIRGIRVIEDYILEITIDAPKAYFLFKLAHPAAYVVDQANVESGKDWWENPNGTGPFKLKEWKKDELFILERNELYYKQPAGVEHVIFRLSGGVPIAMYEAGEIDIVNVGLDDIERVITMMDNPEYGQLQRVPGLTLFYIGFNMTKPPFNDPTIRQAFIQAIDKDTIIHDDLIFKGMVHRADGILPPNMPDYNEELEGLTTYGGRFGYDVTGAKELIAVSSYEDVTNLPPITITTTPSGSDSSAQARHLAVLALVDYWEENLGVKVEVRILEPETYRSVIKEEKDELFDIIWVAEYADTHSFLDTLFHTGSENNIGGYSNPEVDTLLEKARVEQDSATRKGLYQQAEEMIINDIALLPINFNLNHVLIKPYVHIEGYILNPFGIPLLKNVLVKR